MYWHVIIFVQDEHKRRRKFEDTSGNPSFRSFADLMQQRIVMRALCAKTVFQALRSRTVSRSCKVESAYWRFGVHCVIFCASARDRTPLQRCPDLQAMLDYFCIFSKGGAILWTWQLTALRGSPVEALIRTCLLEERSGEKSFNYKPPVGSAYTMKWTLDNVSPHSRTSRHQSLVNLFHAAPAPRLGLFLLGRKDLHLEAQAANVGMSPS